MLDAQGYGFRPEINSKMKSVTDAVEEAHRIGDTLIFIREHEIHNVSMNGVPQSENPKIKETLKRIHG
jgi:hypothetical protein